MSAGIVALMALQQLGVTAAIDRDRVLLGEPITLTIRVQAVGTLPVQIIDPVLSGLELQGSREQTHVSLEGNTTTRLTVREISLIPRRVGLATIGSVVVHVGDSTVATDQMTFSVAASGVPRSSGLDPRVMAFLQEQRPPAEADDAVLIDLRALSDTLILGDQLDVIVTAWFPRAIRSRLRAPPQLQPPQVEGVWAYQRDALGVRAMSRRVDEVWYDLYVHHQALFPLRSGPLPVGPASVSYNLPVSFSFLSRELRHEVPSGSLLVHVAEQPTTGRPAQFEGAAGDDLRFSVTASRNQLAIGDASLVTVTLAGRGNVALWPEPGLAWPVGVRAYPEDVTVELQPDGGLIAGSKIFRYLVVVDSVGTHRIPTPSYSYFDLATQRYLTLRAQSLDIIARGVTTSIVAEPESRRQLLGLRDRRFGARTVAAMPRWAWVVIVLLPPLIVFLTRVRPRVRQRAHRTRRPIESELARLTGRLQASLDDVIPEAHARDRHELADALRAAGVDGSLATHAAQVRDRLWQVGYGPDSIVDADELAAEVQEVFKALVGHRAKRERSSARIVAMVLCALCAAHSAGAQTPERLYAADAIQAAADSFEVRAAAEPWNAAHWYNFGSSLARLGDDVRARAAWLRAARLEPRHRQIRDAVDESGAADPFSAHDWISPVTPAEAILLAAALWVLGWLLVALRVAKVYSLGVLVLALAVGGFGGYVHRIYAIPFALIGVAETPVRVAPYRSADERLVLNRGSAVVILRARGNWLLTERAGTRGWLLRSEVVPL